MNQKRMKGMKYRQEVKDFKDNDPYHNYISTLSQKDKQEFFKDLNKNNWKSRVK